MFISSFDNPDRMYRGTDLWMLNDELSDDELRRQIREMRNKGFYSFIARTYNGLKSDYPGKKWMNSMQIIIDEAGKTGMKVAIQAGFMPMGFPDLPQEYALRYLSCLPEDTCPSDQEVLLIKDGREYTVGKHTVTINLFQKEAARFYVTKAYEEMWSDFRTHFGKEIFSIWVDEPRYHPHNLPWTDELPELFKKTWGYDLIENLQLLFYDIGDYKRVRYQYFALLKDLIRKNYYTVIQDWCRQNGLLLSGHLMGEDYLKTQIANACANMPFYQYFDIPGLDALGAEQNWIREPMHHPEYQYREHMFFNAPIQCVSAAHQAGKENILCEMNGVTASNLGFKHQKHMFDHFAALGVNHRCAHALFYSLAGFRKRFYPHHLNYYQPYWVKNNYMMDTIARTAWFVSQGKPTTQTLILHPWETAYMRYQGIKPEQSNGHDRNWLPENPALDHYDAHFHSLLMMLSANRCSFELADLSVFEEQGEALNNGKIRVGAMTYNTLILPDLEVLTPAALALIRSYSEKGGRIIIAGRIPTRIHGELVSTLPEELRSLPGVEIYATWAQVLRIMPKSNVQLTSGDDISQVLMNYRKDNDCHYIFLCNDDCSQAKQIDVHIVGKNCATLLLPENAEKLPLAGYVSEGNTVFPLRVEAGGSAMIIAQKGECTELPRSKVVYSQHINGDWEIHPIEKNLLTLEYCQFSLNGEVWSDCCTAQCANDILQKRKEAGQLRLRFEFEAAEKLDNLQLVIEEPEQCKITLNSIPVDITRKGFYFDHCFAVLDLPNAICTGKNILEITRDYTPFMEVKEHLLKLFRAPSGVEVESIHLLGNFLVDAISEFTLCGTHRFNRNFILRKMTEYVSTKRDVTTHGFPFYAGEMRLTRTFHIEEIPQGKQCRFVLEDMHACVGEVYINGKYTGTLGWAPYSMIIDNLCVGNNSVEIRIWNTLRNMMGPSHLVSGECSDVHPFSWLCKENDVFLNEMDSITRTDSFILTEYGVGDPLIIFE